MNDNSRRMATATVLSIIVIVIYYMHILAPKQSMQGNNFQGNNLQVQEVKTNTDTNTNTNINNAVNNSNQNTVNNNVVINNLPQNLEVPTVETLRSNSKKIITNVAEIEISELGGKIISYKLRNYTESLNSDKLVELINVGDNASYPLTFVYGNGLRDDLVNYSFSIECNDIEKIDDNTFKILNDAKIILTGDSNDGNFKDFKKVISLNPNSYLFDVSFPTLDGSQDAWVEWTHNTNNGKIDRYNEFSILYLQKDSDKVKKIGEREKYEPVKDLGNNLWLSAGYKYFANTLITQATGNNTRFGVNGNNFIFQGKLTEIDKNVKIYVGPKDQDILLSSGYDLKRSIDLGFFSFIASPLLYILKLFYKLLGNYGLAIILLTLVVKLVFLPLTSSSLKSMKKMSDLNPQIQKLRSTIKDPTKLNQEIMKLYQVNNVNPLGGCLPIFIQIPVFLGLYNALLNSISLRQAPFALWITDLSVKEELNIFGMGVPVMILLMGASMFVQQLTTPSVGDPAQRKAMLITPIIFTAIFLVSPFPSGLVLYWLTNNLISIVQQKILRAEGDKISPLKGTLIGSAIIFGFGYILTLF